MVLRTSHAANQRCNRWHIQPVDLSLPCLRELGAKWLVEISDYLIDNPSIIVNSWLKAGILQAIDGCQLMVSEEDEYGSSEWSNNESEDEESEDDE